MQHGIIIIQEAQIVLNYAESYVIFTQMINVFINFLNVFICLDVLTFLTFFHFYPTAFTSMVRAKTLNAT